LRVALLNLTRFPIAPCFMNVTQLKTLLIEAFPQAEVQVGSLDEVHFTARIVAREFAGLTKVARHRRVYKALGSRLGGEIHALSLELFAPGEASLAP